MKTNDILNKVRQYVLSVSILMLAPLCSCQKQTIIYYNVSYEDMCNIGKKNARSFCIILYDSTSFGPDNYMDKYIQSVSKSRNLIADFVEFRSEKNDWYVKLFRPDILPLTCIFNQQGVLVDLIPGSSMESMKYVSLGIEQGNPTGEFHFNGLYGNEKTDRIMLFRKIIRIKQSIESGKNVVESIDSLSGETYPYLLYFKLISQIQQKDSTGARKTAEALLEYDSAGDLVTYEDELFYAHQILDPGYNSRSAPRIRIAKDTILLDSCKIGEAIPVILKVDNTGQHTLEISDIITSCSCIDLMSDMKEYSIYPEEHAMIGFNFIPDRAGEMQRDIYITSNAYKKPLSHIAIKAYVTP